MVLNILLSVETVNIQGNIPDLVTFRGNGPLIRDLNDQIFRCSLGTYIFKNYFDLQVQFVHMFSRLDNIVCL